MWPANATITANLNGHGTDKGLINLSDRGDSKTVLLHSTVFHLTSLQRSYIPVIISI